MRSNAQFGLEAACSSFVRRTTGGLMLTDLRDGKPPEAAAITYFVIQANVKKTAKNSTIEAPPTQIHMLPISPVWNSPESTTVHRKPV